MSRPDPDRPDRRGLRRPLARRLSSVVTGGAVIAMRIAVRVLPTARIAVVHGFPDTEESSLRIAAELRRTLPARWRVVVLCDELGVARQSFHIADPGRVDQGRVDQGRVDQGRVDQDMAVPAAAPMVFLRRLGLRGYLTATVARLWVHTHGLYGSPRTGLGRCHVLIGHGHGPKQAVPYGVAHRAQHADLTFTNVRVWGTTVINDLGIPASTPRVVTASARADLPMPDGADPLEMRRTVLWLPTVRRTRTMLRGQWTDGTPVSEQHELVAELSRLREAAQRRGLQLATKVHGLDADAGGFDRLGVRVITTEDLLAAGVGFQQLVRSAAALVTDYSSVFVDHLHTQLPIAFWTPDVVEFERDRGFNDPDFRTVAADLFLRNHDTMDSFLDAAARGVAWQADARARLATEIGLAPVDPAGGATRAIVQRILAQLGPTQPGPTQPGMVSAG